MVDKNDKVELREKMNRFRDMLVQAIPKFRHLLPKTITEDRFIEITMLGISKNPRLFSCSIESFYKAFLESAETGLEIGSYHQLSCLVPYFNSTSKRYEARFQIMYRGHIKLIYDNDGIYLDSQVVYQYDDFDYGMGNVQFVRHKPALTNRGKLIAVYTIAKKGNEIIKIEIMNQEQVYNVRSKSKTYQEYVKNGEKGDCVWITDEEEMWRKTGINRIQKYLPLSNKTRKIIDKNIETEYEGITDILDIPEIQTEETQQRIDEPQRKSKTIKEADDIPTDIPEPTKDKVSSPQESAEGLPPLPKTHTPQEAPPLPQPQGGASPLSLDVETVIQKIKEATFSTKLDQILKVNASIINKAKDHEKEIINEWIDKKREEFKAK